MKDCFIGVLVGGAIGDALGMPFERVAESCIINNYTLPLREFCDPCDESPCLQFGLTKGMYTDDTQSSRATTRELVKSQCLSEDTIADALSSWLFDNSLGQEPRYPGITTRTAMENYRSGVASNKCGVRSQTCGASARISPVALWLTARQTDRFSKTVVEIARVTHTGNSAIDGAVIVAKLIRHLLLDDIPPFETVISYCKSKLMAKSLHKAHDALKRNKKPSELVSEIGCGTAAHEVVPVALFHLYNTKFDFTCSLLGGLETFHPSGVDMDCILSITGAIAGAKYPEAVLDSQWMGDLEDAKTIIDEAQALYYVSAGLNVV